MNIDIKNRQIRNIIILYSISILYWTTLVVYREFSKNDIEILKKNIIFKCNGWCMSHFFHYLLLGYCAPKYWPYIILIGILFEIVVEFPLTTVSKYIDSKLLEDSITNTLGIIIGVILSKIFPNNINLYKLINF